MNSLPVVIEISPAPAVSQALVQLSRKRNVILFDSSLIRSPLGRYSFLAADPFEVFSISTASITADPFVRLEELLQKYSTVSIPGLPPFQGGAAGLLSYELGRCFERLPAPQRDEFQIPLAIIGLYSWVLAWDHEQGRCWFFGQGFPEELPSARIRLAEQQGREVLELLGEMSSDQQCSGRQEDSKNREWTDSDSMLTSNTDCPLPLFPGLRSNFSREEYLNAVQIVIDKIAAGDIFQANLSQRFVIPARRDPMEQYLLLRERNPAPFAGFFAHEDWAVLSSSPERFLQVRNRMVSTRPIKGTRQRGFIPEVDLYTRDELRESEKDRAENIMIVDLLRNDLSKVCLPGTIRVSELCTVEAYQTVSHLVSEIHGTLRPQATFWDLLKASFPGGSITGLPKFAPWKSLRNWSRWPAGPIAAVYSITDSMGLPTAIF